MTIETDENILPRLKRVENATLKFAPRQEILRWNQEVEIHRVRGRPIDRPHMRTGTFTPKRLKAAALKNQYCRLGDIRSSRWKRTTHRIDCRKRDFPRWACREPGGKHWGSGDIKTGTMGSKAVESASPVGDATVWGA